MLISHRKKFIYLKTRKTGGTSVEVTLEPYARPEGQVARRQHDPVPQISDAGIIGARGKGVRDEAEWFNHMPASLVKNKISDDVWDSYLKICNVRNPWDKVVSYFHYRRRNAKDKAEDIIFKRFNQFLHETEDISQDISVFTINDEPIVDEFIRYESLDEDFARVCKKLDLDVAELPVMKANARGTKKIPYQRYYDEETKKIVAERFQKDIEILGYTFEPLS